MIIYTLFTHLDREVSLEAGLLLVSHQLSFCSELARVWVKFFLVLFICLHVLKATLKLIFLQVLNVTQLSLHADQTAISNDSINKQYNS